MADACAAGGGTVFFPKGVYLCDAAPTPGTYNSILNIPYTGGVLTGDSSVSLRLLGEVRPAHGVVNAFDDFKAATIKTTRTTDTSPAALMAGNSYRGEGFVDYTVRNGTKLTIENLNFRLPDDPKIHGLRMEGMGEVRFESVNVIAGNSLPTHGTVALWTPDSENWGENCVDYVLVSGFDTGVRTSEHLFSRQILAVACKVGVDFGAAIYTSYANIQIINCIDGIKFSGIHPVDLLVVNEHAPSGPFSAVHDISDATNNGVGTIRHLVGNGGLGTFTPATMLGGTGLTIIETFTGDIKLATTAGAGGSTLGAIITGKGTVPTGGTTGQALRKVDNTNYNVAWGSGLPADGATSGKLVQSNGSLWAASTQTWPTTNTAGYSVRGDGTNYSAYPLQLSNASVASVSAGYAADTYLAGSSIAVAAGDFKAKGIYHCVFDMVKTAAGTATPIIIVRVGTLGTTGDAAQLTFTFGAGTAVADTGMFELWVNWRTVGSGTAAVVQGICKGIHNLATTGLFNNAAVWTIVGTPSAGFNSSTATIMGVSFNGGASFSGTNTLVQASITQ
jgi:hypothetical protein